MAGKGGARPGAGRKPKAQKYERPINRAEKQIVDKLPQIVEQQLCLALGGIETVRREYVPAGTVTIGNGDNFCLAFPDVPADELVLIKEIREVSGPDRGAGQYLINRILGTPTVHVEDNTEQERRTPPDLLAMIEKVYGDANEGGI